MNFPRASLLLAFLLLLTAGTTNADAAVARHGVTATIAHRTLTVSGDRNANRIALRVKRTAHNTLQVDAGDDGRADFSFNRKLFDKIALRGGGGNDALRLDEAGGGFTKTEHTSVDGQSGSDRLAVTGNGSVRVAAAAARVRVSGSQMADGSNVERVDLGARRGAVALGDLAGTGVRQVVIDGSDALRVAGSPAADNFAFGRFGPFVHLQRDALAIDAQHVARIDVDAAGGADTVALSDLTGTDLKQLNLGLGGNDGQADSVSASGSDGPETIAVAGGLGVGITGLAPAVSITGTEPGDTLAIDGRGGADGIDASGLPAGRMRLTLRGGPDADTLTGSPGDDTFRSTPGDGADTVDGKGGIDTAAVDGSSADDTFSASANGARVQLTRGPDGGAIDAAGVERVDLNGFGGADTSIVNDLTGTEVTQTNVDMGAGDGRPDSATVNGTAGADNLKLAGGGGGSTSVTGLASPVTIENADPTTDVLNVDTHAGADSIDASNVTPGSAALALDGGQDADTLTGSAGDDAFVWKPGDGNDVLDGKAGTDTLRFNGSNADETVVLSANGPRLRLDRDIGAVTQDAAGVEHVDFNAIGGADAFVVNDLTGTDVTQANVDLGASGGGGDGAADHVVVQGTANPDNVSIGGDASAVHVTGRQPDISIKQAEVGNDTLVVNGLAGADNLNASGLAAGAIGLLFNGATGADTMTGSQGDDTFVWNPGDQSDTIEGEGGTDTLQFNGANINEQIGINPNGPRLRFTRDVAAITMDVAGVEHVNFFARGGADTITVGDLSGTDVTQTKLDLSNGIGAGDGAADNVIVNGTNNADTVHIAGSAGNASVTGLHSSVSIATAEPANDRLTVNGADGDDAVEASGLAADAIALTLNGGNGADVLVGGAGNDTLHGDADDDVLTGGPGQDVLDGGTGNNVLIQ